MSKKNSGSRRIPNHVQEFVKKLYPDALHSRLRNFRKFVVSTVIEKRNTVREAATPHNSKKNQLIILDDNNCVNIAVVPSINSISSQVKNKNRRSVDFTNDAKNIKHTTNKNLITMDVTLPYVIVQEENDHISSTEEPCHDTVLANNSLQLLFDAETPPRNKSPVTVQEWVNSLPLTSNETSRDECDISIPIAESEMTESDILTLGAEAGHLCVSKEELVLPVPPVNVTITSYREPSEVESHCSSVDSLLESRKPDPEEILLSLGFGGTASSSYLETGRIPKRFLNRSQLKGVDINEFIKQQQDLIYTFESGYYGYRGLAGPSHSNPSVIVAKILEKLRDHEKETASMNSYPSDFRKRSSVDRVSENESKKFSKVARNVLTKIRCTPGSVLSPDNRRWLDSQGNKSPEIARRLIIGQKSFTFGNDGDLIESSNPGSVDERTNENKKKSVNFEIVNKIKDIDDQTNDMNDEENTSKEKLNQRLDCHFTDSSTDFSIESIIMNSNVRRQTIEEEQLFSNAEQLNWSSDESLNFASTSQASESTSSHKNDIINNDNDDKNGGLSVRKEDINNYAEQSKATVSSLPECETNIFESRDKRLSLREELKDLVQESYLHEETHSSAKRSRNVLTRCSSFEESVKSSSNSDNEYNLVKENDTIFEKDFCSEKMEQFSDSATESEFASYPSRTNLNKNFHKQYEELILLKSKLQNLEQSVTIMPEEQFASISSVQRTTLQLHIIREALKLYLHRLKEDEINVRLKNCLTAEAHKVADLLDKKSNEAKLSIIVRQMTLLLHHQSKLSAQIKELSEVEKIPSSCHEMCGHILQRVQELELLVHQNAQELAHMKYQLLNKNN